MDLSVIKEQQPLLFSIAVFVLFLLITWLFEHIAFKLVKGIGSKSGRELPASSIFANIARVFIWLLGIALGAKVAFGYDLTGLVAALGIGGLAISLGMQDTLQNLIGGLFVSAGKIVLPGEYIEVGGKRGRVEDTTWRHTTMMDAAGKRHIIPNSIINKSEIVELGSSGDVALPFLLPLGTDVAIFSEKARAAVEQEMKGEIGGKGVRVLMGGSDFGGIRGQVVVDAMRSAGSESVVGDRIARSIDPLLNPS